MCTFCLAVRPTPCPRRRPLNPMPYANRWWHTTSLSSWRRKRGWCRTEREGAEPYQSNSARTACVVSGAQEMNDHKGKKKQKKCYRKWNWCTRNKTKEHGALRAYFACSPFACRSRPDLGRELSHDERWWKVEAGEATLDCCCCCYWEVETGPGCTVNSEKKNIAELHCTNEIGPMRSNKESNPSHEKSLMVFN